MYIITKDKSVAEIVTDRFTIPLGGNFWNTGFLVGTAFQQSVDFMVIAIDEAVKREVCVRRAAQQMADLGHVMPDQLRKLNNSNFMGQTFWLIAGDCVWGRDQRCTRGFKQEDTKHWLQKKHKKDRLGGNNCGQSSDESHYMGVDVEDEQFWHEVSTGDVHPRHKSLRRVPHTGGTLNQNTLNSHSLHTRRNCIVACTKNLSIMTRSQPERSVKCKAESVKKVGRNKWSKVSNK